MPCLGGASGVMDTSEGLYGCVCVKDNRTDGPRVLKP